MKISDLIEILEEQLKENGDLDIVGIANGEIYPYVYTNCPGEESPLYIELCK